MYAFRQQTISTHAMLISPRHIHTQHSVSISNCKRKGNAFGFSIPPHGAFNPAGLPINWSGGTRFCAQTNFAIRIIRMLGLACPDLSECAVCGGLLLYAHLYIFDPYELCTSPD